MSAAPLTCDDCDRRIGAQRPHLLTDGAVLCLRCFTAPRKHAEAFPDCPDAWHDMHDHPHKWCTRAAAVALLDAEARS